MATRKQTAAARENVKEAQVAARRRRPRPQLYELARQRDIEGRSKIGKWDLIEALRAH